MLAPIDLLIVALTSVFKLLMELLYFSGHDFVPMVFTHDNNNKLSFISKLDQPVKKGGDEETMSAMQRFRSMDKRATTGEGESKSETTHTNSIK